MRREGALAPGPTKTFRGLVNSRGNHACRGWALSSWHCLSMGSLGSWVEAREIQQLCSVWFWLQEASEQLVLGCLHQSWGLQAPRGAQGGACQG